MSADKRKCTKDETPDPTPTVNVYFPLVDYSGWSSFDSSNMCFLEGSGSQTTEVNVTVNISGGPPGVGTLTVSCQGEAQVGTAYPGSSQSFTFPVNFAPGSNISASATYTINGVTYNGSANFQFYDFCGSGDGGAGGSLM